MAATFVAAGCVPNAPGSDEPFLLATARAAVAFAEAEIEAAGPGNPTSTCDACGGSGTVPSGDGLARVPCPCGEDCRCEPPGDEVKRKPVSLPAAARRKRILYFTAPWCAACRGNDATLASLRKAGWQIGAGEENHIQTVDLDLRPDLAARHRISAVPVWLLIDADRELCRRCGRLDPFAVGKLFESVPVAPEQRVEQPPGTAFQAVHPAGRSHGQDAHATTSAGC